MLSTGVFVICYSLGGLRPSSVLLRTVVRVLVRLGFGVTVFPCAWVAVVVARGLPVVVAEGVLVVAPDAVFGAVRVGVVEALFAAVPALFLVLVAGAVLEPAGCGAVPAGFSVEGLGVVFLPG